MRFRYLPLGAIIAVSLITVAQAATQDFNFSLTSPTYGLNDTVPTTGYVTQFDPSLGTLTSVSIIYTPQAEASNTIHNSSTTDTEGPVQIDLAGSFTIQLPSGTQVLNSDLAHTTDTPVTLNPQESVTVNTHYTYSQMQTDYNSNLAVFIGLGNWAYVIDAVLTSASLTASFPDLSITNTEITSYLNSGTVTYTYTAAPEPSVYALIGVGVAAMVIFRKRGGR